MTPSFGYVETLIARLLESSSFKPLIEGSREERLSYLVDACSRDEALRARLYDLLTSLAGSTGTFPASPPPTATVINMLESALAQESREHDESVDSWIGPYHLLQKIGEGGFGTVWMAEQMEPVRRMVALKIIKRGMDTREVISRFEAERQALAMMDHPNIARVFDAGSTDNGRPYFVMELVRGLAITRYCDEVCLPAKTRLQLYAAVCNGVQHAHQKGIIHRDLKPSNILVTLHDGVPVPKIIDFGIAKAIGPTLTDRTLFTQFHAFIGTPAYTSPEQMELSGLDVDTRSDVYSLGVLLYELLTGRPPFDPNTLAKSGLEAMRRVIREVDPPSPSDRLKTLSHEARSTVAQQRSTDAAKLSLLLRGDLDWIVMRCLEKDRTRRYETASALARDVQRHLESEPVTARPPTAMYRISKFIQRHKGGVITFSAVAISLAGGLVVSSLSLVRERAARTRAVAAEQEQATLRREAESARELEIRRSARAAIDLANQLLAEGKTAEALAYLVHVARKDPADTSIAPRLASVLTSHNFLIPEGPPIPCGSRALALRFTRDGRSILVGTEDGTFRTFDSASGALVHEIKLGKAVKRGGWVFARDDDSVFAVRFIDDTIAVLDTSNGQPRWSAATADFSFNHDVGLSGREAVQLSPDGRWCYVNGLYDFRLFDAASGHVLLNLHFNAWHFGPDFSPDGHRVALSWSEVVHVWSLPDCTPAIPMHIEGRLSAGFFLPPFFTVDGQRLVACDVWAGIHVFDATSGQKLKFIGRAPGFDPTSIGFLPNGRLFLATDRTAELLDLDTEKSIMLPVVFGFAGHSQRASTPDGRLLLTASIDGLVRLWDTTTGSLVAEPSFHQSERPNIALSYDGNHMVVGTADGKIVRLRAGRGRAAPLVLPLTKLFDNLPFLPENPARVLLFEQDRARAIDVASGRNVAGGFSYPAGDTPPLFEQPHLELNLRRDLRFLLVRDASGTRTARAWEARSDGSSHSITLESDIGSPPGSIGVAFSASHDLVAHARGGGRGFGVWDLRTGAPVGPGCTYKDLKLCLFPGVDFSPDGKWLAGGVHENSSVAIWEAATGRVLQLIKPAGDAPVEKLHFSSDGRRLLTLDERHQAQLWDPANGKPMCSPIPSSDAFDGGFSPDGEVFATWGYHSVRIWNGHTGALVSAPDAVGDAGVRFTRDGLRFVACDNARLPRVWDVRSGQPITEPLPGNGQKGVIEGFSPDGTFVQVVANDQARVWSVPPNAADGGRTPEWLLRLALICAAKTIDDRGQCVDALEYIAQIDDVKRELAAQSVDTPLVAWARWFLDTSPDRSIAPGFSVTRAQADALAKVPDAILKASP